MASNAAITTPTTTTLSLTRLATDPETFQFREFEVTERHVRELVDLIKKGKTLDPLSIWLNAEGKYIVIDGHHRHAAYQQADVTENIPVLIYECSEAEALLLALAENAKTRLQMKPLEKRNAAWRLCCSEHDYSKRDIRGATGISDGTVAKMRRVRKALLEEDAFLPDTWGEAMRDWNGMTRPEFTDEMRDALIAQRADELDAKIGNDLGRMSDIQWEAVAEVLHRRLGRNSAIILEYLSPAPDDDVF